MSQCEEDDGTAHMYALSWGPLAFSGRHEHLLKVVPWLMITSIRMVGGCTRTQPTFFMTVRCHWPHSHKQNSSTTHFLLEEDLCFFFFFFWKLKHTHVIHKNQRCLVRALHDKLASKLTAVTQRKHSRLLTGTDVMCLNIDSHSDNRMWKKQKMIHGYQKISMIEGTSAPTGHSYSDYHHHRPGTWGLAS